MRCPACGAHNTDAAEWCSQCLGRLGDAAGTDSGSDVDDAPEPAPAPTAAPAAAATRGDVRTRGGDVEWRCGACDTWNPFPVASCRTCGAPMVQDTTTAASTERARRMLWAVAAAVCVVTLIAVVLLIVALQGT